MRARGIVTEPSYPRGVGFGIDRRATSRKAKGGLRGLLGGKAPDARELGERFARLAKRMFAAELVDASPRRVTLGFHPGASPVRLVVLPDGDLEVTGDTGSIGPGYHAHVLARLAPLLEELELRWDGDARSGPIDVAADMLAWLQTELRAGATRIGMPAAHTFVVTAAVQTALGPRDAAWRDAVLADAAHGADAFGWWETGPGCEARSRALHAIWHEVPWREPLDAAERALLEEVAADLHAAHRAAPALELPWPEWAAVLDLLGDASAAAATVRARAAGAASTAGYRRYSHEVEVAGDWTITLPGDFVAHVEDDGERWWATDGNRLVELTTLTANETTDSASLLAVAPERHPVMERSAEGARLARFEAHTDGEIRIAHGLVAVAPHVAILTCKSREPDDGWALAVWRSLRHDG